MNTSLCIYYIGHGGHLQCAMKWFGGLTTTKSRHDCCPTGCGHRCNMFHNNEGIPKDYIIGIPKDYIIEGEWSSPDE